MCSVLKGVLGEFQRVASGTLWNSTFVTVENELILALMVSLNASVLAVKHDG